jgi:hypothetical protein
MFCYIGGRIMTPNITLGPLTRFVVSGVRWDSTDSFPGWQAEADEFERLLCHLVAHDRFHSFLPRLRLTCKHRIAALAEARASFFFHRIGFRILEYEPLGDNNTKGDLLIQWRESPPIFVEVKAPSWHGEVAAVNPSTSMQQEWIKKRFLQPKFDYVGCVADSASRVLEVVEHNALKKLRRNGPNLVVVADDLFVSALGFLTLESKATELMSNAKCDRLSGLLLFKSDLKSGVDYRIQYLHNPSALASCALPAAVKEGFVQSTAQEKEARRKRLGTRSPLSRVAIFPPQTPKQETPLRIN